VSRSGTGYLGFDLVQHLSFLQAKQFEKMQIKTAVVNSDTWNWESQDFDSNQGCWNGMCHKLSSPSVISFNT
jgi:hypothetical protein